MDQEIIDYYIEQMKMKRTWKWSEEAKQRNNTPELLKARSERMRIANAGIPKSEETKEKMSRAKIGRKKSEEHRAAMKETHLKRGAIIEKLFLEHPHWTREQIFTEVRRIKEENNNEYPDWR